MSIFVSYSHKNQNFVVRLVSLIQQWGHDAWVDFNSIPPGEYWPDEIDKGLQTSDVIVGVLTQHSMDSRNVKNEWDWALENNKPLILLRTEECDISHRYIGLNYIDLVQDENAGLARFRRQLEAPQTVYRDHIPADRAAEIPTEIVVTRRDASNRDRMLAKVRAFWVEGVLEKALLGETRLELTGEEQPDAVRPTIERQLENPILPTYTLSTAQEIVDVFDDLGNELLILGAPGSGKTITMLELARGLLNHAEIDQQAPIPVVFNLSSWAETRAPFHEWIVTRLNIEYQVPKKVGRGWLENGQLSLLLDGLDEVIEAQRDACVEAINTFRRDFRLVDRGIVVCSRIADYEVLTERLNFDNAITLQPLTVEKAENYLTRLGAKWTALKQALRTDNILRSFATSPLMLNIMAVAYRDIPARQITGFAHTEDQQNHLLENYVDASLQQRGPADADAEAYSPLDTVRYLTWLARKMVMTNQTVFFIEDMQHDWLETRVLHRQYSFNVRFIGMQFFIVIAILATLIGGAALFGTWELATSTTDTPRELSANTLRIIVEGLILIGLAIAIGFGLAFLFGTFISSAIARRVRKSIATWISGIFASTSAVLVVMVIYGLLFFPLIDPDYLRENIAVIIGAALVYAVALGGGWGLAAGFVGSRAGIAMHRDGEIEVVETLSWNWRRAGLGVLVGAGAGVIALVLAVIFMVIFGADDPLDTLTSIGSYLAAEAIIGVPIGIIAVVSLGLSGTEVELRTRPNQGIRRSVRNALRTGLPITLLIFIAFAGVTFVIILLSSSEVFSEWRISVALILFSLFLGAFVALPVGLSVGLLFGGISALQHGILRVLLYRDGYTPGQYARFLDFAASKQLLRRVGGGYIFRHRTLLEYFASLDIRPTKRRPLVNRLMYTVHLIFSGIIVAALAFLALQMIHTYQQATAVSNLKSWDEDERDAAYHELVEKGWWTDGTMRAADLENVNLAGYDLSRADLENVNFRGAKLIETLLTDADLRGANLANATLYKASLINADLRRVDLAGAALDEANLTGADLRNARLVNTDLTGADLTRADLRGANLLFATMDSTTLLSALFDEHTRLPNGHMWDPMADFGPPPPDETLEIPGINLASVYLTNKNLAGADLSGADFHDATLVEFNLQGANLRDTNWQKAHIQAVQMQDADLTNANLRNTYAQSANLTGANLTGADLNRATLSGANLAYADLSNADLRGANLERVILYGATLTDAQFDQNTILPDYRKWTASMRLSAYTEGDAAQAAWVIWESRQLIQVERFEEALDWLAQTEPFAADLEGSTRLQLAVEWDRACWNGSLAGSAELVLSACEQAVTLYPDYPTFHDSRGIARALTGDLAGALDDFQFAQNIAPPPGEAATVTVVPDDWREEWITALEAGLNPFDETTLAKLSPKEEHYSYFTGPI